MNELTNPVAAQTPCGINHVVLNVRDMEMAHWFWTECLGFRHVATSAHVPSDGSRPMRFYSGEINGKLRHHDIALVERATLNSGAQAFNHVAIAYATEAAFQRQIAFLLATGVALHRRVDRGVTRSIHLKDPDGNEIELVHELPREAWEGDIEAALNHAVELSVGE
jgi:catechol 2,3-dioxygenase